MIEIHTIYSPFMHVPRRERLPCCATVRTATKRHRDSNGLDYQCDLLATVKISGAPYCERHAGIFLLEGALSGSLVIREQ